VKLTFGRFLQDAALFYRQLACKLQAAYGAVGFSLEEAQLQTTPAVPDHQYTPQDCKPSVYRCLICLGDIFRYAGHHCPPQSPSVPNRPSSDFSSKTHLPDCLLATSTLLVPSTLRLYGIDSPIPHACLMGTYGYAGTRQVSCSHNPKRTGAQLLSTTVLQ